jgi:hypothetical protein
MDAERLAPQKAHTVEHAAIARQLGEAVIVAQRADQPAPNRTATSVRAPNRPERRCGSSHRKPDRGRRSWQADRQLPRRRKSCPTFRAVRNLGAEKLLKRPTGADLDEVAEHIGGHRVIPLRARLETAAAGRPSHGPQPADSAAAAQTTHNPTHASARRPGAPGGIRTSPRLCVSAGARHGSSPQQAQ